jgi:hypothetical protein
VILKKKQNFFTIENIPAVKTLIVAALLHVNLTMQLVKFKLSINKLHAFSSIGSLSSGKHHAEISTLSNLLAYNELHQARFQY